MVVFAVEAFVFFAADALAADGFAAEAPLDALRPGAVLLAAFAAAATASAAALVFVEPLAPLEASDRRPAAGASPRFRERRTGRERGRLERTSRWVSSAIG